MTKLIQLLALASLAAVAAFVGVVMYSQPATVSANNGPHGGYTLTTSACAGCHRAHTAVGEALLKAEDTYALCTSCHGGTVQTNVLNGVRTGDSAPLNGGGFETVGATAVTSAHNVEGLNGGTGIATAWGSQDGTGDAGVGVTGTLECTSCHNPHGSTNYRILKDGNNGYPYGPANASKHRWVPDDPDLLDWVDNQVLATKDDNYDYAFTAGDCTGTKCRQTFTSGITAEPMDTTKGMNAFCATCHKSYLTKSHSGGEPSDTGAAYVYPGTQDANDGHGNVARYRHAVMRSYGGTPKQPLRFAAQGNDPNAATLTYDGFGCLTCHYAHGTTAAASGFAAGVAPTNDSALLFYDNRGVCISCHQTVAPTPTPVP